MAGVRPVAFVGPSLPYAAAAFPALDVRPPAARGDLLAAAREGATLIGFVDGRFGDRFAVSPTEVRQSARRGARILGAASMGALRAAECPGFIEPVGGIAAAFIRGDLQDEDEVACAYDPHSFVRVSYPLINLRAALRLAADRSRDVSAHCASIIAELKALSFDARTPDAVREIVRRAAGGAAVAMVEVALCDPASDEKGRDAACLLRTLADWSQGAG